MHAACGKALLWYLLPNSGMEEGLIASTGATQFAVGEFGHFVEVGRALHAGAQPVKDQRHK